MSGKTPTPFAEQGRKLVYMAFDHDFPPHSLDRALVELPRSLT